MCPPPLSGSAEPAIKRKKKKIHLNDFQPVHNVCTTRHSKQTHENDAHHKRDLFPTDHRLLKKQNHKSKHHNVFFNTEIKHMYPYASPEGDKRLPPRGDDLRQQKGTLGAAMRLQSLRQAPPEITKQPKTPKQLKNNQKSTQTNPRHSNTMPTCYGAADSPHKGAVRGKLERPRGAHGNPQTCLTPTPPIPDTTNETTKQPLTDTWRPNR
jgi:hypothetical protein